MRLRYKLVTYHFGENQASQQSLERHYRELMDELLRQGQHHAVTHHAVQWRPAADIHETSDAILVKMELAGMREEDIEVTLYEDALVVSGSRDDDVVQDEQVYYHEAQIRYGPFRAEILLPGPVSREGVDARYENGFLRVTLPKLVSAPTREKRVEIISGKRGTTASQPLQASGVDVAPAKDTADEAARPASVDAAGLFLAGAAREGDLVLNVSRRGGVSDA
jgi:HSP20 family protein